MGIYRVSITETTTTTTEVEVEAGDRDEAIDIAYEVVVNAADDGRAEVVGSSNDYQGTGRIEAVEVATA